MSCNVTGVPGCNVTVTTGGGADLEVKDEGISVETNVDTINFIGGLVTATNPSNGAVDVTVTIPEVTSDPVSPANGDAWVLKTGGVAGLAHSLVTLGLTLGSGGGGGASYEFRYKTVSDGVVGVALT